MDLEKTGLVLEGGGMKGVFTAGVLEFFLEENLFFPYITGVSAGACQAVSYLSRQKGRNKAVNVGFITDHRYLSYRNLIKHRSIFGMDFMFDEIPNKLVPFDYKAFEAAPERLLVGTTDCFSGEAVYFEKGKSDILQVLRASCSLPFVSQVVKINGRHLLDGGMTEPIPIRKALADGMHRNVVILTKHPGYRREPFKGKKLAQLIYPRYKGLVRALEARPQLYNDTLDLLGQLEEQGKVFIIRPQVEVKVDRLEKDKSKLEALYNDGYNEARRIYRDLLSWLEKSPTLTK